MLNVQVRQVWPNTSVRPAFRRTAGSTAAAPVQASSSRAASASGARPGTPGRASALRQPKRASAAAGTPTFSQAIGAQRLGQVGRTP